MQGYRIVAVARKEMTQILRDTRSLIIVVLMPPLMMLLFGYGVNLDTSAIPMCVLDREGSQQSQSLLTHFQSSRYFDIVRVVDNYPSLLGALDEGGCRMGIVIPPRFSKELNTGGRVGVQLLVDAIDDNTANLAFSYSESVVRGFSADLQVKWQRRQGLTGAPPPLRVESRVWFNEVLESKAFIVPGVIALVLTVIGTFLTSLTVARERERGTLEQLISTPLRSSEIMLGKLIPYFVICVLDFGICTAIALWAFRVAFRGSWFALLVGSAFFLVVVLAMGYLISVLASTQLAASQTALVTAFLPAFLLSGFIYPIDQMPVVLRAFTHIIPARYYVGIIKGAFLKGTPIGLMGADLLGLAIIAAVVGTLATQAFQKTLD